MGSTTGTGIARSVFALTCVLACPLLASLAGCESGDLIDDGARRAGGFGATSAAFGDSSAGAPFADGTNSAGRVPIADIGTAPRPGSASVAQDGRRDQGDGAGGAGGAIGRTLVATTRLTGASADVDEIDVAVDWRLDADVVGNGTRLEASLVGPDGGRRSLARTRIRAAVPSGTLRLVLPLPIDRTTLVLEATRLEGRPDDAVESLSLDLPAVVAPPPVALERLESLSVSLVSGSASSATEAGRRVHRFAVRVDGELAPEPGGRSAAASGRIAVTGLDADASAHFRVREDGNVDPESPVRATWRSEPIAVYLVLDTSASIVLAGAADLLLDAVTRTLGALAPVATFDYRTVSTRVRRIEALRDVEFDTDVASGSGTAFHHALDTALDDIEARDEARAVVIGFTDGRDFASRNFHPELGSDEQVLRHVASRLRRVRRAADADGGRDFEAHFASLGSDIDVDALDALAGAGGGSHVSSSEPGALEAAFGELTAGLRGLYRLEYSSQRLAADSALELEVSAGPLTARVALP